jgi:hypothetical protein
MISNIAAPVIQRVGTFTESSFGISSSEDLVYIFDILRSKLYSNKIAAVIREYSTNAADANTECGKKEKPVVITAPTRLAPEFKVRDYGFGLTEDQIRNVYCMYGKSTKRDSNEYTGQLGLGSKSGFAYGDSFSIVSYKDGVKHTYTAYIDETRLGSVAKTSENPTTEENGIEIVIPVNISDIRDFEREITRCLKYFKVKPIVVNLDTFETENEKTPLLAGDGWQLYNDEVSSYTNHAICIMGNIGYPINQSMFSESRNPVLSCGLRIEFDIGDLSISANREELEYNKATKQKISSRLSLVEKEIIAKANSNMSQCKNIIEAKLEFSKLNRSISHITGSKLKWNGVIIDSSTIQLGETCKARLYSPGVKSELVSSIFIGDKSKYAVDQIFYHDGSGKNYSKVSSYSALNNKRCLLLELFDVVHRNAAGVETILKPQQWLDNNHLTLDLFKKASELPDPPRAERKKNDPSFKGKTNCFYLKDGKLQTWGTQSDNYRKGECNKLSGGLYLRIETFMPCIKSHKINANDFKSFIAGYNTLTGDTLDCLKIPCFKTSDCAKLGDKWIAVDKHIEQALIKSTEIKKICEKKYADSLITELKSYYGVSGVFTAKFLNTLENRADEFTNKPEVLETIRLWSCVKNLETKNKNNSDTNYNTISAITSYYPEFITLFASEQHEAKELRGSMETIKAKYPLLDMIRMSVNKTEDINHCVTYISKL